MKKTLSILLALLLSASICTSLMSCEEEYDEEDDEEVEDVEKNDDDDSGNNVAIVPISRWTLVDDEKLYENVTFTYTVSESDSVAGEDEIKISQGKLLMENEVFTEEEMMTAIKNGFVLPILTIAENGDQFVAQDDPNVYKCAGPITLHTTVSGTEANVTMSDITVTFDGPYFSTITCKMKQEVVGDSPYTMNFTVTFTFSNYGTTVIE